MFVHYMLAQVVDVEEDLLAIGYVTLEDVVVHEKAVDILEAIEGVGVCTVIVATELAQKEKLIFGK